MDSRLIVQTCSTRGESEDEARRRRFRKFGESLSPPPVPVPFKPGQKRTLSEANLSTSLDSQWKLDEEARCRRARRFAESSLSPDPTRLMPTKKSCPAKETPSQKKNTLENLAPTTRIYPPSEPLLEVPKTAPMFMKTLKLPHNTTITRILNPEEFAQAKANLTLGASLNRNITRIMSKFCEANLYLKDVDNFSNAYALENIGKLVLMGKFPKMKSALCFQVIEMLRQFRHAHSHYDLVYLLMYNDICLSAVVIMTGPKMLNDPAVMKDALEKLKADGGPCNLPTLSSVPICEKAPRQIRESVVGDMSGLSTPTLEMIQVAAHRVPTVKMPCNSQSDDEERRLDRLRRFAKDQAEVVVKMIDTLMSGEQTKKNRFDAGETVTVLLPSEVSSRGLLPKQRQKGWINWDLINPLVSDMSFGIRDFAQPILYPSTPNVIIVEPTEKLHDLTTLFLQGQFGDPSDTLFPLAIEWAEMLKHALAHFDLKYLLLHGHLCLSAVVIIANMINRSDIRITALQLLRSAGFDRRCDLPREVPPLYVKT